VFSSRPVRILFCSPSAYRRGGRHNGIYVWYANNEGRSIIYVLDLAVNLMITATVGSPVLHLGHAAEKSNWGLTHPYTCSRTNLWLRWSLLHLVWHQSRTPSAQKHRWLRRWTKSNVRSLQNTWWRVDHGTDNGLRGGDV